MYLLGLPELTSEPQPGPLSRLGKAQGSVLPSPSGSPSVPKVGVNGTPVLAFNSALVSHPFAAQASGPEREWGPGICHVPAITKVWEMLKSDRARSSRRSNTWRLDGLVRNSSPTMVEELVSMLLPHVYEPRIWKPWANLCVRLSCRAWEE